MFYWMYSTVVKDMTWQLSDNCDHNVLLDVQYSSKGYDMAASQLSDNCDHNVLLDVNSFLSHNLLHGVLLKISKA